MLATLELERDVASYFDPPTKPLRRREEKALKRNNTKGSKSFQPLNLHQEELFDSLATATQIIAIGEAGTGKTYVSSRHAARQLASKKVEKVYIARPTVSAPRHRLGFLPGKLEAKLEPWLIPIMEAFKDEWSPEQLRQFQNTKALEFVAFEHLRGRTLRDAVVILDEAQNCTYSDLKTFVTRKGENSQFIITGDPTQIDIPDSGFAEIVGIIKEYKLSPHIVEFDENDVVRSDDAREWVTAFKRHEGARANV